MVPDPPCTRRTVLEAAGATAGLAAVAGCSALLPDGTETSTPTPDTTAEQRDAVVALDVRADEPSADDVALGDLPEAEREIARTAIEEGYYRACPPVPEAIRSFANRFGEARYLADGDDRYGAWIHIWDVVYVDTAPAPGELPDCG